MRCRAMALGLHSEDLQASWVDAYGHLNEGYYLVVFSNATWALQDHFGVGPAYTTVSGKALYTAESHIRYLREVRAPAWSGTRHGGMCAHPHRYGHRKKLSVFR